MESEAYVSLPVAVTINNSFGDNSDKELLAVLNQYQQWYRLH